MLFDLETYKEEEVPAVDLEIPSQIRSKFVIEADDLRSQLDRLTVAAGQDRSWKFRERQRLVRAFAFVRAEADRAVMEWATDVVLAMEHGLGHVDRDTRKPKRQRLVDLRANQLSRSVQTKPEAGAALLGRARQLVTEGEEEEACAHALAAVQLGVPAAVKLLTAMTWPGRTRSVALAQSLASELTEWQTVAARCTAEISRSSVEAERSAGLEPEEVDMLVRPMARRSKPWLFPTV